MALSFPHKPPKGNRDPCPYGVGINALELADSWRVKRLSV